MAEQFTSDAVEGERMIRRRSSGTGSVRTTAAACGRITVKETFMAKETITADEIVVQGTPGTAARRDLVEVLNGEREPGKCGFYVTTYADF